MSALRRVSILVLAIVLALPTLCWSWRGKVVKVTDGDLMVVSDGLDDVQIRLYGIDCPAKGQRFWANARSLVAQFTEKRPVEITPVYKGPDGTDNALVKLDATKEYLNLQLVGFGMAWIKPNACSAAICAGWKEREEFARNNAVGLWADPDPVPPWEWKKQQRLNKNRGGENRAKIPASR